MTEVEGAPASTPLERVRQLEHFALERLPALQLSDGAFCHQVSAGGSGRPEGRSLRYTLIVLIGLLRAEEHDFEHPLHTGAIRARIESELSSAELTPGDLGLALWADSRMEASWAGGLVTALRGSPAGSAQLRSLPSMEVAWILTGLVEAGIRIELGEGEELLDAARSQLLERRPGGHLVLHLARGPRRRLPHFADQIYSLLALSQLARVREDAEALEAAVALGRKIVELQMPNGAWPWICDPLHGTVVEPYEIYSIHQDSMAMMGLHSLSAASVDPSFRAAALRGLDWNYGENELGAQMFDPGAGMIYRSIRRTQRFARVGQAHNAVAAYAHAKPRLAPASRLEVNRTMRPYHLGWILEAWAGKEELATA
ncbi:MAG: hypothetical protein ACXWZM_04685 [Solirubrobacterales bacterium]